MRPETWPLGALPALFSGLMASGFDVSIAGLALLVQPVLILCVLVLGATNMFNEVYDVEQDRVNKPHRPIVSGRLSPRSAKAASLVLFVVAVLWALSLGFMLFTVSVTLVCLGVAYSVPEMRLKDNAATAMLTLGMGYGVIMPLAPWLIISGAHAATGSLIALMSFLWFAGTTNFKDFKDLPGDVKSDVRTLVAMRGEMFTMKLMAAVMVVAPACLLVAYVAAGLLPASALLALAALLLTLWVIADLYRNYSPKRAFRGYKITYLLYPLFFLLLAVGFLGGR